MDFAQVIISFLGIQDVTIEDVKLFKKDLRVEIQVRQKRESCFCPRCGLQFDRVKEWWFKKLKAPPLGIFQKVIVKFYQMRGICLECNQTAVSSVNWIHPKFETMTTGFAEVAGRLMEEITCEGVSRILKTQDSKQMWSLDQLRMETMLTRMRLPPDLDVSQLSADEVHFRTLRLEHRKGLFAKRTKPQFITNLVCFNEAKVLFNGEGRDSKALEGSLAVLSQGQKLAVEFFAVDMHEPFISVIQKQCPNAQVCIDRFHLVQKMNEAFDKLRKSEFKIAREKKG